MIHLLVLTAHAQIPVVHLDTLGAAEAVALVAQRSGLPDTQLSSTPVGTILASPMALLGPGSLRRCARAPTTLDTIRSEAGRARAALLGDEPRTASSKLDVAVVQLGCLTEVVDRRLGSEIFLLRGAHHAAIGDLDMARDEFLTALAFDPRLTWDDALPEAGQAPFKEAQASTSTHTVQFVPESAPSGPWLDGGVASEPQDVAAALHLVQVATGTGIDSAWLVVDGPAAVVVPPSFRPAAIETVGTEAGNDRFGRLLAATVPDLEAAYVVHEGGVWSFLREEQDLLVNQLAARVVAPEPEPETRKERRARRREERRKR